MTGFDETVPPDLDPADDATSASDARENVPPPAGGPTSSSGDAFPTEQEDADEGEPDVQPFAGDDDIAAGHPGEG